MIRSHDNEPNYLQAAAVGLAAGLFAAWVMDRWQAGSGPLLSKYQEAQGIDAPSGDATAKAADKISKAVRGRPVAKTKKADAGKQVHYLFGATLGVLYAVLAERWDGVAAGFGSAFGLAVDLLFDEAIVPAAKLSEPGSAYPASSHAYGLASHLIYGVSLEGARRLLRGG